MFAGMDYDTNLFTSPLVIVETRRGYPSDKLVVLDFSQESELTSEPFTREKLMNTNYSRDIVKFKLETQDAYESKSRTDYQQVYTVLGSDGCFYSFSAHYVNDGWEEGTSYMVEKIKDGLIDKDSLEWKF